MAIKLEYPECMTVSQGVMYAAVAGYQPDGGDGRLLTLIKTERSFTVTGNNTWSVISATPIGYFGRTDRIDCDVDKNGVFTMRLQDGAGYRYDPLAPKVPRAQTCSSDGNGLGEWKRMDLVEPDEVDTWRRLILQPEAIPSVENKSNSRHIEGDEMSKNPAAIEILQYGNGQIFSVLASGPSIAVSNAERNAKRTTYNKTLVYFPFEAAFHLTSLPSSAVSLPWNVDCNDYDDLSVAVVAKSKFYYVCAV
ncbi:hypothetical protein BGZ82_007012 [Podila clonocystis]|nr:hypothetical protein BGZ82_007012 [Podila clonocystis]